MPSQKRPTPPPVPRSSPYAPKKDGPPPSQRPEAPAKSSFKSNSPLRAKPGSQSKSPFQPKPQAVRSARVPFGPNTASTTSLPVPSAMVTRRASESLRAGHLWVYASDVERVETGSAEPPALIPVVDNRGIPLGTALYSATSQIALRLVSRELLTQAQWLALLAQRLRAAVQRRLPLLNTATGTLTDACRLVFSEADDLPGLVVDKYADIVALQLLTKGLDTPEARQVCAQTLAEALATPALTIWERPDPRIRELEGLSAPSTEPLFAAGTPASSTLFHLNGLSFHFDANSGQKTGAFLDQRQNYAAVEAWAKTRNVQKALDVCTYQGGFALHLARVCRQVTGIDASRASLEVAERNLDLNRSQATAEVDWIEADAFEVLRAWSDLPEASENRSWDLIVLDPPAFAKSKRAVEGALRGYKELNLRALKLLKPSGLLVTFSCSHHVTWTDLESAVASAAVDAHRRVTLLERRGAALDHPVLLNLPETEYLKCLICQVD